MSWFSNALSTVASVLGFTPVKSVASVLSNLNAIVTDLNTVTNMHVDVKQSALNAIATHTNIAATADAEIQKAQAVAASLSGMLNSVVNHATEVVQVIPNVAAVSTIINDTKKILPVLTSVEKVAGDLGFGAASTTVVSTNGTDLVSGATVITP